jgi:hypothetical protein
MTDRVIECGNMRVYFVYACVVSKNRWEDIIKIDLKEMEWKRTDYDLFV